MFFEEGWVPLSDVTAEVFRRMQDLQAEGHLGTAENELRTMLAVTVWDICDACTKIGATAADGTVLAASKELLSWADPRDLSNEHVNLMYGSVGSTTLADGSGKPPSRDQLVLRYGPFMNLPLVLPVNNFQSSLTFLEEEVKTHNPKDPEILRAAKTVIEMLDAGKPVTRDIARKALGAGLSRRKLKFGWALAAQHRPDLAAPNRWLGL